MNEEIVLKKFRNKITGDEFDLNTPFVERTVNVPTVVDVPLYENGEILSAEDLSLLDLEVVGYTQEQLDAVMYTQMFVDNADLAKRVRIYKNYLDELELPYDANSDQIQEKIVDNVELANAISSAMHDVEVNLSMMGGIGHHAWAIMPTLIKYLPEE